jgi:hypothetical protein
MAKKKYKTYRLSVSVDDKLTLCWLDVQNNKNNSLKELIRKAIETDGMVDAFTTTDKDILKVLKKMGQTVEGLGLDPVKKSTKKSKPEVSQVIDKDEPIIYKEVETDEVIEKPIEQIDESAEDLQEINDDKSDTSELDFLDFSSNEKSSDSRTSIQELLNR